MQGWGGQAATIDTVAIDLNGQRERSKEWCFAAMRTAYRARTAPVLLHPADRLGDVGAATTPLLVGLLASHRARRGAALAVASSTDGLRGAVTMEMAASRRPAARIGAVTAGKAV
jgi:3-oxoacyl-[acyl-carrier-protein] synthase-1